MAKELRQAENKVIVEGLLSENKLVEKQNEDGRKYISGELLIETAEGNVIPVTAFSFADKNGGGVNKVYTSLQTVMNTFKSIAAHGRDAADKVRVTSGELGTNEFYAPDGRLVSYFRIRTNFINRVLGEYKPRAEFQVEAYVSKIMEEIKNDQETGRVVLQGIVPQYGNRIAILNFIVDGKKAVAFVNKAYSAGDTVKLAGNIISATKTVEKIEEVAFGDPIISKSVQTTRELAVSGGTAPYLDKDNPGPYTQEDIKAALVGRAKMLEELKAKSKPAAPKFKGGLDDF